VLKHIADTIITTWRNFQVIHEVNWKNQKLECLFWEHGQGTYTPLWGVGINFLNEIISEGSFRQLSSAGTGINSENLPLKRTRRNS
jgi:hypothetical protein